MVHKKGVEKDTKKGTERHPLKLTPDKVARQLLDEFLKKENFDFANEPHRHEDLFLLNVVGNQFLSKPAIRIAVFLHDYFHDKEGVTVDDDSDDDFYLTHGEMFMTCEPRDKMHNDMECSEDYDTGDFLVNYKGLKIYYDIPFPNLVVLLYEKGIAITSSNLNKILTELHDFHYITLTPAPTTERQKDNKKRVRRAWRHIRLYRGMCDKSIFNHLYDLDRPRPKYKKSTTSPTSDPNTT